MNSLTFAAVLIVLANSMAFAQLAIDNPKHLDVPEEKARVLLRLACRAVAKEFHSEEASNKEFDFRLVLGEKDERYGLDEQTRVPTLYLQQWSERKFTTAAVRLAVQRSIDRQREERMVSDILKRSEEIVSIPVKKLRGAEVFPKSQTTGAEPGCLYQIRDASQRDIRCGPPVTLPGR